MSSPRLAPALTLMRFRTASNSASLSTLPKLLSFRISGPNASGPDRFSKLFICNPQEIRSHTRLLRPFKPKRPTFWASPPRTCRSHNTIHASYTSASFSVPPQISSFRVTGQNASGSDRFSKPVACRRTLQAHRGGKASRDHWGMPMVSRSRPASRTNLRQPFPRSPMALLDGQGNAKTIATLAEAIRASARVG